MLELNNHYSVTVVKVLERGAVVAISGIDNKTGFIHISNISESFVSNINDYLSVGQTYDAVCTDIEKFSFSVKHLGLKRKAVDATQRSNHAGKEDKKDSQAPQKRRSQPPEFHGDKDKKAYSVDDMIAKANASLKDKQKHKTASNSVYKKRKSRQSMSSEDIE